MSELLDADPAKLKGDAATLHTTARELNTGQFDLFLLDWTGDPASHPDVASRMREFAEFAHDQYRDVVALLAGLATRVEDASVAYLGTDEEGAADITRFLTGSTHQPAK